jgi:hypothetical protein
VSLSIDHRQYLLYRFGQFMLNKLTMTQKIHEKILYKTHLLPITHQCITLYNYISINNAIEQRIFKISNRVENKNKRSTNFVILWWKQRFLLTLTCCESISSKLYSFWQVSIGPVAAGFKPPN